MIEMTIKAGTSAQLKLLREFLDKLQEQVDAEAKQTKEWLREECKREEQSSPSVPRSYN